ncbi:CRN108 [Symbiodinium microadriaticum]|nr:CRN108 [Symbiodinium microadriaticum]
MTQSGRGRLCSCNLLVEHPSVATLLHSALVQSWEASICFTMAMPDKVTKRAASPSSEDPPVKKAKARLWLIVIEGACRLTQQMSLTTLKEYARETAQKGLDTAQQLFAMAVDENNSEKIEAAEKKVVAAEKKVEAAEKKVEAAKKEVEDAETKVEAAKKEVNAGPAQDWCQKLRDQKLEFGAGDALLNTIGAKWDYCGREDLVNDLQAPFACLCEHKGVDADKQNHPLLIAFAGPGQGKSRLLSELPAMIEECRKKLNTEQVRKYKKTLAFLITCENGTSPGDWATEELNARRFVACRMLWQLRAANQVLQAVPECAEETTIVVLGVDGMQGLEGFDQRAEVAGKSKPFYGVMQEVCRLVNEKDPPLVVGCVSATQSLDHGLASSSPQRRYRLTLPRVTRVEEHGKDKVPPHPLKDLLVRDMGGHGRALEALVQALQPARIGDGSAANVIGAVMFQLLENYPNAGILGRSDSKAFDHGSIKAILRTALSGKWVCRGDKLGNVDAEKAYLIRLRYNDAGTQYFIEVPYIWLHMMLTKVAADSEDLAPWRLMDYDQFLRDPPQDGTEWEEFNAAFRVLRSWAFEENEAVPVRSLHSGAIIQPGTLAEKMVINRHLKRFKAKLRIATASNVCGNPKPRRDSAATEPASHLAKHECRVEGKETTAATVSLTQTDVFVLNAKGAPAADAVLRLQTKAGDLIAECLQMKHGQSACDLEAERAKACGKDDIFVVLRNINTDTPAGQNLIFVSEGQFAEYYGMYSGRAFSSVVPRCLDLAADILFCSSRLISQTPRAGSLASYVMFVLGGGSHTLRPSGIEGRAWDWSQQAPRAVNSLRSDYFTIFVAGRLSGKKQVVIPPKTQAFSFSNSNNRAMAAAAIALGAALADDERVQVRQARVRERASAWMHEIVVQPRADVQMTIEDIRAARRLLERSLQVQLSFFVKVKLQMELVQPAVERAEVPLEWPADEPRVETYFLNMAPFLVPPEANIARRMNGIISDARASFERHLESARFNNSRENIGKMLSSTSRSVGFGIRGMAIMNALRGASEPTWPAWRTGLQRSVIIPRACGIHSSSKRALRPYAAVGALCEMSCWFPTTLD